MDDVRKYVADVKLGGEAESACKAVEPLLHRAEIFGVDLGECGLEQKVKEYFALLIASKGAVRSAIKNL